MPDKRHAGSRQDDTQNKSNARVRAVQQDSDPTSTSSPWFVFTPPITVAGTLDGVARDQIRRQAAHASSAQRISTIRQRNSRGRKNRKNSRLLHPAHDEGQADDTLHHASDDRPLLRRSKTELSRRSSTAPSDTDSYSLSRDRTPFSAPASPREVLGAGRVDPFLSFPTENRHPIISMLVDHFLTHFAPAPSSTSNLHGRDEMRLELWPEILRSRAMFDAVILFTGTHLSICKDADASRRKQQALWLRQTTLGSINAAVSKSTLTTLADDTIAAVAMLAGWELEFGERANFDIHMRVLRDVVAKRAGGAASLPPAIWRVLLTAGKALPSFASGTIYFNEDHERRTVRDLTPRKTTNALTPGFALLCEQWLVQPRMCELVVSIVTPESDSEQLNAVYRQLIDWDPYVELGTSYCFLQTQMEDDINAQGELHIIVAGVALCSAIASESRRPFEDAADVKFTSQHCSKLEPHMLLKTVYEDLAAWALFIICAEVLRTADTTTDKTSGFAHKNRSTLTKLLRKLDRAILEEWQAFQKFLSRYTYPSHLQSFQESCHALWRHIVDGPQRRKSAGESLASRDSSAASDVLADGENLPMLVRSEARYRSGVQHPTLVVVE